MTPNLNLYGMLSDLGRGFGGIAEDERKRRMNAAIGEPLSRGDYAGAAKAAATMGEYDTGVSLLKLDEAVKLRKQQQEADAQATQGLTGGVTPMSLSGDMAKYRDAIASIESKGSGDYAAIGPQTKGGDRAYGRYQVMGSNIPTWTKEVLGRSLTPQEFLSDQKAQDAVFDAKFSGYLKSGGPQNAASMWFTGRPAAQGAGLSDVTGTTGNQYVNRFMQALGPQRVQVADNSGRIPASAGVSGGVTAGPDTGALEARRADLENRLLTPNISDNVRTRLQSAISAIDRQIARSDRQQQLAQSAPSAKLEAESAARMRLADEQGLTGDARQRYLLTGQLPSASEKAPTGEQANAATFATRMDEANKILSDPNIYGSGMGARGMALGVASSIPVVGNAIVGSSDYGEKYQQYEQAKRDFVNAVLRKESGAAIGAAEFANAEKQYFPQPGDKAKVIEQKAKNRATAIETIAAGGAPSFQKEFARKRGGGLSAPPPNELSGAQRALAAGVPREVVIENLRAKGFDASGL